MQLTTNEWLSYRVGLLEARMESVISRGDDRWSLVMSYLAKQNGHGKKHSLPWLQISAYGATALFSLLGITVPERLAALLKMLMH